ncbi:Co-chaperone [Dispira simplex]|nr:Co-chaperone [Dispira simplex]
MSNWKNVNNWHWTEKNCINWSKDYFKTNLPNVSMTQNGFKVQIDQVTEVNGDVDLNQRKGKVITIFDVAIKLDWSGSDPQGENATGTIYIPEVAHDTKGDDYVFDITVASENAAKRAIKEVVRKDLVPLLREKLINFQSDLIEAHRKDVYIEPEKLGTPTPPRMSHTGTKVTSISSGTVTPVVKNVGNTTTISDTIEFVTSAAELYLTLTDPGRVAAWTRAPPQLEPKIGGAFALFGGNVNGRFEVLEQNRRIVQTWRLASWPADYYSKVTIELDEGDDSVRLHLTQTGVPIGEEDQTRNNWQQYYWRSIKATFGLMTIISTTTGTNITNAASRTRTPSATPRRKSHRSTKLRGTSGSATLSTRHWLVITGVVISTTLSAAYFILN